jgi:hypothetical protein
MHGFMLLTVFLNGKRFVTNITSKWTLFTMYALVMAFHVTLRNERFFAHITAIWTITTV